MKKNRSSIDLLRGLFRGPATFIQSSEKFVEEEKKLLSAGRGKHADDDHWTGLALSGGGIRSATFCLGVLQALSALDLLKKFDYLSSVSGGGYIASSLQWWWSKLRNRDEQYMSGETATAYGTGPKTFPFGTRHPSPNRYEQIGEETRQQRENLNYLRNHSNYLLPGNGINIWSAVAVLFRTPFLNLLVWIPAATLLFAVVNAIDDKWLLPQNYPAVYRWFFFSDSVIRTYDQDCYPIAAECWMRLRASFVLSMIPVFFLIIGLAVFALILVLSSRVSDREEVSLRVAGIRLLRIVTLLFGGAIAYKLTDETSDALTSLRVLFFVPFIVATLSLGVDILIKKVPLSIGYFMRRTFELLAGKFSPIAFALLAIGIIPIVSYHLIFTQTSQVQAATGGVGLLSILAGIVTGMYGHFILANNTQASLRARIIATIGAAFFLYAILVASYVLAVFVFHPDVLFEHLKEPDLLFIKSVVALLFALAVMMSLAVNINQIGLHRFYRDRLMEAFMPSTRMIKSKRSSYSPFADSLTLTELWPEDGGIALSSRPYPIINTNVVLVNDADQKFSARGGDSFILSPFFVGSTATGWDRTQNHFKRYGPITLASAMAASGAAANANAGYIGTGLTRNRLISMVMILLNMRLGLWIGSPAARRLRIPQSQPNHWRPGLGYALFRAGYRSKSTFLELSDGGHFENLGLYELIRRKAKVMLVIDGEADPTKSLSALVSAARRVNEDFAATISFDPEGGPAELFSTTVMHYPQDASYPKRSFIVAEVRYYDGSTGAIIYLKALVIKELSFVALGYKAKNPDFPNQTTLDQFFSPDQFEAYRELGYESASNALKELDLLNTIDQPELIISKYRSLLASDPRET